MRRGGEASEIRKINKVCRFVALGSRTTGHSAPATPAPPSAESERHNCHVARCRLTLTITKTMPILQTQHAVAGLLILDRRKALPSCISPNVCVKQMLSLRLGTGQDQNQWMELHTVARLITVQDCMPGFRRRAIEQSLRLRHRRQRQKGDGATCADDLNMIPIAFTRFRPAPSSSRAQLVMHEYLQRTHARHSL